MPGVLASEQSNEVILEGKGGPRSDKEETSERTEEEAGEKCGPKETLKKALEELSLDKNGETVMDEDDQQPRLSSPDSGTYGW